MPTTPTALAAAHDILARHPLIDGHNDLLWELRDQVNYDFAARDISGPVASTCTDIPRLRAGGVGAQFWSVFVPSNLPGHTAVTATLEQIEAGHRMIAAYPQDLAYAVRASDIEAAFAAGKIASLLGAEGGQSIGESLGALRALYTLGVRYMTLTHNDNNPWADSATDVPVNFGLSDFGRDVVREMNKIGMMVDLSHVSADTMNDALDTTSAPVIFSHSSARAICPTPRNVPDEVLARIPGNGGICMVTFVPEFVSPDTWAWRERAAAAAEAVGVDPKDYLSFDRFSRGYAETEPKPDATVAQVADHIEHVREVAGIDHVGVGGDFDGTITYSVGLEDVSSYPNLIAELIERNWSEADVAKLTNGNLVRVMHGVEDVAGSA